MGIAAIEASVSPCSVRTEEVENNIGNDKLHLSWDNCWFALTTDDGRMPSTDNVCPEKLKLQASSNPSPPPTLNILQYSCLCVAMLIPIGRRESGKIL